METMEPTTETTMISIENIIDFYSGKLEVTSFEQEALNKTLSICDVENLIFGGNLLNLEPILTEAARSFAIINATKEITQTQEKIIIKKYETVCSTEELKRKLLHRVSMNVVPNKIKSFNENLWKYTFPYEVEITKLQIEENRVLINKIAKNLTQIMAYVFNISMSGKFAFKMGTFTEISLDKLASHSKEGFFFRILKCLEKFELLNEFRNIVTILVEHEVPISKEVEDVIKNTLFDLHGIKLDLNVVKDTETKE